jgi:hypothetical protein
MRSIKQQSCYAHTQHLIIPEAESTLHTARRFTGKEFIEKRKQKLVKPTRTTLFLYSLTLSGSKAGIGMFSG